MLYAVTFVIMWPWMDKMDWICQPVCCFNTVAADGLASITPDHQQLQCWLRFLHYYSWLYGITNEFPRAASGDWQTRLGSCLIMKIRIHQLISPFPIITIKNNNNINTIYITSVCIPQKFMWRIPIKLGHDLVKILCFFHHRACSVLGVTCPPRQCCVTWFHGAVTTLLTTSLG